MWPQNLIWLELFLGFIFKCEGSGNSRFLFLPSSFMGHAVYLCSSSVPMKTNTTILPQSFSIHRSDICPIHDHFVPRETRDEFWRSFTSQVQVAIFLHSIAILCSSNNPKMERLTLNISFCKLLGMSIMIKDIFWNFWRGEQDDAIRNLFSTNTPHEYTTRSLFTFLVCHILSYNVLSSFVSPFLLSLP